MKTGSETASAASGDRSPPRASAPIAALVHLSGDQRGTTQRLSGDVLTIGTSPEAHVVVPPDPGPGPLPIHATLHARGRSYELFSTAGADVWVNGQLVDSLVLASGDVLEIGQDGPILRYRLYLPESRAYKTVYEAFADCVDCVRHSEKGGLTKATMLARGVPLEIATQTSRIFRSSVVLLITFLIGSIAVLAGRSAALEEQLAAELERVDGIAELVEQSNRESLDAAELAELRTAVESLSETERRIETLEEQSGAAGRVVAEAMESTLFIQGAYGFVDPETGRPLRVRLDASGNPLYSPFGDPALTLEGEGPVFEVFYTGTGFVVDALSGLLMTNRHVALPWQFDDNARGLLGRGFEGTMRRFQAYLPSHPDAFDLELITFDEEADLAVLSAEGLPPGQEALLFAESPPAPGDEVVVVGFPLGVRALVARAAPSFLDELRELGEAGFWEIAARLAEGDYMAPLVTRGIVGQVTDQAVVYDAETTSGGSGGPVLALSGGVIAINSAILPEFGGSNLGVPAARAVALLEVARAGTGG